MNGPLGGIFRPDGVDALAEQFQFVGQRLLDVVACGGIADQVLEACAVVVADPEINGVVVPLRIGCQPSQPAE